MPASELHTLLPCPKTNLRAVAAKIRVGLIKEGEHEPDTKTEKAKQIEAMRIMLVLVDEWELGKISRILPAFIAMRAIST